MYANISRYVGTCKNVSVHQNAICKYKPLCKGMYYKHTCGHKACKPNPHIYTWDNQTQNIYKLQSLLNELLTLPTSSLYLQSLRTIIRWLQIASIHDKFQHLFIRQALVRLLSQAGDFPKDHPKGPANDN